MEDTQFQDLSLPEKESYVKEKGQFVEAQDFYSFFMVSYLLNQEPVRLLYDYSGKIVEVETGAYREASPYSTEQLTLLHYELD